MIRRDALPRRPRAALLWGLLFYAACQVYVAAAVENGLLQLRNPKLARKLGQVRAVVETNPGRPLVLALGSSKLFSGFRPDVAEAVWPPREPPPVIYNAGMEGLGPAIEFLTLHRLLDNGIRPHVLILEVLTPRLSEDCEPWFENSYGERALGWRDWPRVLAVSPRANRQLRRWLAGQLAPVHAHRQAIMNLCAPGWLPWPARTGTWVSHLNDNGWIPLPGESTEDQRREWRAFVGWQWKEMLGKFRVNPDSDRALRYALADCRREGIRACVVVMPESSEYQSWYSAEAHASLRAYLARLASEEHIPVIDARGWADEGDILDGHHLTPTGATRFTARFTREVLVPLAREDDVNELSSLGRTP